MSQSKDSDAQPPSKHSNIPYSKFLLENPLILSSHLPRLTLSSLQAFKDSANSNDESRLNFLKESIYKFKENIFYNNYPLPTQPNFTLSPEDLNNYFNYSTISFNDFDTINAIHFQTLKQNYIKSISEPEEKTCNKLPLEKLEEKNIINLLNNLLCIFKLNPNDLFKKINQSSYISNIIQNYLENLIIILKKEHKGNSNLNNILNNLPANINYHNELFIDYDNYNQIENLLNEILDKFIENYISIIDTKNLVKIINKFQIISLLLHSSSLFIKILFTIKNNNLVINNFNSLYKDYFKHYFNPKLFTYIETDYKDNLSIFLNYNISSFTFYAENNFIYLLIKSDNAKNTNGKLLKIYNDEYIKDYKIYNESAIDLESFYYYELINNKFTNELYLFYIKNDKKYNIIVLNKENINSTKQLLFDNDRFIDENIQNINEIKGLFHSETFIFVLTDKNIYKINIKNIKNDEILKETYTVKNNDEEKFSIIVKNNTFYFKNFYVFIIKSKKILYVYDIIKNNFKFIKIDDDFSEGFIDIINNNISSSQLFYEEKQKKFYNISFKDQKIIFNKYINFSLSSLICDFDLDINRELYEIKHKLNDMFKNKKKFNDNQSIEKNEQENFNVKNYFLNNDYNILYSEIYDKEISYFKEVEEEKINYYFKYFYLLFVKYYLFHGDKKYLFRKISNKSYLLLTKNYAMDIFNNKFLLSLYSILTTFNNPLYKNSTLLIISNVIKTINEIIKFIDIPNLNDNFKEIKNIFDYCYKNINNEFALNILKYNSTNSNSKIKYNLNDIILLEDKNEQFLYSILLCQKDNKYINNVDILNIYFNCELDYIFNSECTASNTEINTSPNTNISYNIIYNKMKKLNIKYYKKLIINWNSYEKNEQTNNFTFLFDLLLNNLDKLISKLTEKIPSMDTNLEENLNKKISNSLLCELSILIINKILINTNNNKKNEFNFDDYYNKLYKIIIKFDKFLYQFTEYKKKTFNYYNDINVIYETEHPYEISKSINYSYDIDKKENLVFNFDCFSNIKNGTVTINNFYGPYNESFPIDKLNLLDNKLSVNLIMKENNDKLINDKFYGYKIKCCNYNDIYHDSKLYSTIYNFEFTFIYSVCEYYTQIINREVNKGMTFDQENKESEKEDKKQNEVIDTSSTITTDVKDQENIRENVEEIKKFVSSNLMSKQLKLNERESNENKNKAECEDIKRLLIKVNKIFDGENSIIKNIDNKKYKEVLDSILKQKTEYKNIFNEFHKEKKLGNAKGNEYLKEVTLISYCIILKNDVNLLDKFILFANEYNKTKQNIQKISNYDLFIQIFSHLLKIKVYLKEIEVKNAEKIKESIKQKLLFLLNYIHFSYEKHNNLLKSNIDTLISYIKNEKLNEKSITKYLEFIKKINNYQNISLSYMNNLLVNVNDSKNIKNILFWINQTVKNDIIKTNTKQLYLFLFIMINKLLSNSDKDNTTFEKTNYDLTYYYTVFSSLFLTYYNNQINDNNYEFISLSNFIEIFRNNHLIKSLLYENFDITKLKKSEEDAYKEINYLTTRISIKKLSEITFNLFEMIIINLLKENNNLENNKLLNNIIAIIIDILVTYINQIKLINLKLEFKELINDSKLNGFLLLLYKILLIRKQNIKNVMENNRCLLYYLFDILLYSSDKNKYVIVKIIDILFNETNDEEIIIKSIDDLCENIKVSNLKLYDFILKNITLKKEQFSNYDDNLIFFFSFLLSFVTILQQVNQNIIINTKCNKEISYEIITSIIRKIIINKNKCFIKLNKHLIYFIVNYIKNVPKQADDSNISNTNLFISCMLSLGLSIDNFISIGSNITYDILKRSKSEKDNLYLFDTKIESAEDLNSKNKKGIIIGFTESPIQIFNIANTNNDRISINFNKFSYSFKKYAYIILEEDMAYMTNKFNIDFKISIVDTSELNVTKYNVFTDPDFISQITQIDAVDYCYSNLSSFSNKYQYIILSFIHNILEENNDKVNNIFLKNKYLNYLYEQSLNFSGNKRKLIPLEFLNYDLINEDIYKISIGSEELSPEKNDNTDIKDKNQEKKIEEINTNIDISSEFNLFYFSSDSVFVKFNSNSIKELEYKKIYNYDLYKESKNYIIGMRYEGFEIPLLENKEYALVIDIELLQDELASQFIQANPNIKYIITNNEIKYDKLKLIKIPIIFIDNIEFQNSMGFFFEKVPTQEFEDLFLKSVSDFSTILEIPSDLVDDTAFLSQKNLILKVLGKNNIMDEDSNNNFDFIEEEKVKKSYSIDELNKIYAQCISLLCRRLLIIYLCNCKDSKDIDKIEIKKIINLLLFEMNIFFQSNKNNYKIFKNYNDSNYEIIKLIRNFIVFICKSNNKKMIKELLEIDFILNGKYLENNLIEKIDNDEELTKYENFENRIKIIFSIYKCINNDVHYKYYQQNLFQNLIKKEKFYIETSNKLYSFVLDILFIILREINNNINSNFNEDNNKIKPLLDYFNSEQFGNLMDKSETIANSIDIEIKDIDSKILLFVFAYFDFALNLLCEYNIDANLSKYFNFKILNFYLSYSLMSKKYNNKGLFLLFMLKRGIIPKNIIDEIQIINKYSLDYYDKKFEYPYLLRFENTPTTSSIKSYSLIIKSIDPSIISANTCIFLYQDPKCIFFQDYINSSNINKTITFQNENNNQFYISFPYSYFKNELFCCGKNEKHSLGIGGNTDESYIDPQKCLGLDNVKNIYDIKFGYYHTFIHLIDGNLYACGGDDGSSFKNNIISPSFCTNTHFQDLAQKEGMVGIWVNNFNASILLTKKNNLYGCGVNNEFCLSDAIVKGPESITIPKPMSPIKPKVKELACGYKSSFFVLEDGTGMSVGSNEFGQCGAIIPELSCSKYHAFIPPKNVYLRHVIAGEEFFAFLVDENGYHGRLFTLGCYQDGRTGTGKNHSFKFQKCKDVENLEFIKISSRNDNCAAITSTGELYVFGFNEECALGLGDNIERTKPTKVNALNDYIIDDVAISHFHMIVIARNKKNGFKTAFSVGTKEHSALGHKINGNKISIPEEIKWFSQKNYNPIKGCVSRFQSYFMTMNCDMAKYIGGKLLNNYFICENCKIKINGDLYFKFNNGGYLYYCNKCVFDDIKNNREVFYSINKGFEVFDSVKEKIENIKTFIPNQTLKTYVSKSDLKKLLCKNCKKEIDKYIYISLDDLNISLCNKCYESKCKLITHPHLFLLFINAIPDITALKLNPFTPEIFPSIVKHEKPYLEFEIKVNLTDYEQFKLLLKNKEINNLFTKYWKKINIKKLYEITHLKDYIYTYEEGIKDNNYNYISPTNSESNFDFFTEKKNKVNNENIIETEMKNEKNEELENNYFNINNYLNITNINEEEFKLLFELSNYINDSMFDITTISAHFKEYEFLNKIMNENMQLISSKERLNYFEDRLQKLKKAVNSKDKSIDISRIKASKFYEKNKVDVDGNETVFGQLFHAMKNYNVSNYLCGKENRLFTVNLIGEGSSDYGGPYGEVLSVICNELQSNYLNLFLPTPNNKNDIGIFKDKYIPNPNAKSSLNIDMYYFLGLMIGHAISSGFLLNLNLHPLFWNKLINLEYDDFNEIETLDKLYYKLILELEEFQATSEEEFKNKYSYLTFSIILSDGTEQNLIPNGKNVKVILENKDLFIQLSKKAKINEYNLQIESIRNGLLDTIPLELLNLLIGKELEEKACGKPDLNLSTLKRYTEYQGYSPDETTITNFWKVLESFNREEKISYLKYVWGRTRLPDPEISKFTHTIGKLNCSNPDSKLPTSSTCYFTLKLPNYSSYEIMRMKLKYAINNCSEIDTDFIADRNEFD